MINKFPFILFLRIGIIIALTTDLLKTVKDALIIGELS
jgi:hypothetical protein